MIFAFIINMECCWTLSDYVRHAFSSNYVRQVGWRLARRNLRGVLGRAHFPTLFIIYSNYFQCLGVVKIKNGGRRRVYHF